jgi:hypothetical protein
MVDNKRGEGPGSFLATDLVTKATYRLGAAALAAGAVMCSMTLPMATSCSL